MGVDFEQCGTTRNIHVIFSNCHDPRLPTSRHVTVLRQRSVPSHRCFRSTFFIVPPNTYCSGNKLFLFFNRHLSMTLDAWTFASAPHWHRTQQYGNSDVTWANARCNGLRHVVRKV